MPKVELRMQSGERKIVLCEPGENLLALAESEGISIDAPCSGNGACGKCRVRLVEGSLDAAPSRHLSAEAYEQGWRLACEARVTPECAVFVPDTKGLQVLDLSGSREQAAFGDCLKDLENSGISFDNPFLALPIAMEAPNADDPAPDGERLTRAIRKKLGVSEVRIPHSVMVQLARTLRENNFTVCAKGERKGNVFCLMALCAPGDQTLVGCAIDVGTTTVAVVLTDLANGKLLSAASCANAQLCYGADVIHRIIRQGEPGGRERLQGAIVDKTLNPLLRDACRQAGVSPQSILRFCVAANTAMNHLLVGADAQSIRMEPYVPSFFRWDGLLARDLGLCANPEANVVLSPNIGSFVGGDITAGVLATCMWNREEMSLFLDLGTNGEIVLGGRDYLIGCACSAGPAFEGGDISCGMRAAPGAVEHVTLDDNMEPHLRVIGGERPAGLCGSGLIDLAAELFRTGAINPQGRIIREGSRVRRENGMACCIFAHPWESGTGQELSLTETDLDNLIRAKAAVFSAIETLLKAVDLTPEDIDRVLVAGGIGSGLSIENAISIGMLPDMPREKFCYVGNTSLLGAYAMTRSHEAYRQCCRVAEGITYLELSTYPGYMDSFLAACFLPHTDGSKFPSRHRT